MNPYLLLGVLLGVAARTLIPFLLSGNAWDWRYIGSAIWGAVIAIAAGTFALPVIQPDADPFTAALLGFFGAISIQSGARQVEKAASK